MEVKQVQLGEERAFPEQPTVDSFLRAHWDDLVALAYVLSGSRDVAQDAVQEVAERMLTRDLTRVRDLHAYSRRAVTNACTSGGRTLGRRKRQLLQLRAEWHRSLATQPDPFQRIELMSALQALSSRQRAAIVLRYYLDLPEQDIANALGCAPATVRSLLSRGVRQLRIELSDERGES